MYAFTKPADFEFSQEKVLRLAEQQAHGVTSLEGQLSSARTSNLFTHVITRVFHRSGVNRLRARSTMVPHERTHIPGTVAATRLVWTAVIFNSRGTSGQTVGYLKCAV